VAGKVSAGLVESNGGLPLGLWRHPWPVDRLPRDRVSSGPLVLSMVQRCKQDQAEGCNFWSRDHSQCYCRDYNCDSPWYDYSLTTTHRAHLLPFDASKKWTSVFRRSRIVVISQSNRTHVIISITFFVVEWVMVLSYHSRIIVESQLWYRLKTMSRDHIPGMGLHLCCSMWSVEGQFGIISRQLTLIGFV